jgi:hypothetical protein
MISLVSREVEQHTVTKKGKERLRTTYHSLGIDYRGERKHAASAAILAGRVATRYGERDRGGTRFCNFHFSTTPSYPYLLFITKLVFQ